MKEACSLIWTVLIGLFRTRSSLVAEILVLRHQINVLQRHSPKRQTFSSADRLIFAWLYRLTPTVLNALAIVKPETVIKWHRAGFRSYWRWKSRRGGGRPTVPPNVLDLIREMSIANPLWGAPRIHGELLKLGIDVGQTTVAKYMVKTRYAETLIGSIRRECLDHVVVFGERHLRYLLRSYQQYYNAARTHLSVNKDAPSPRTVHAVGRILPTPFLGGLHHLYVRV